jgi:5'-deoxynucleotidase YfbR-like HD superfamily hydrolase
MEYSRSEAVYNHRMAGRIRRLHIKPMNGDEQNIAAHSWGVAMILLDLFPCVSRSCLVFALRHDVPEIVTGDVPANVKWQHPGLQDTLEWIEEGFLERMGWPTDLKDQHEEKTYIRIADRVELLFYCLEQIYMGNLLLIDVFENVREKLNDDLLKLHPSQAVDVQEYIKAYSGFLAEKFSKNHKVPCDVLSIS